MGYTQNGGNLLYQSKIGWNSITITSYDNSKPPPKKYVEKRLFHYIDDLAVFPSLFFGEPSFFSSAMCQTGIFAFFAELNPA